MFIGNADSPERELLAFIRLFSSNERTLETYVQRHRLGTLWVKCIQLVATILHLNAYSATEMIVHISDSRV